MAKCDHREYGPADVTINKFGGGAVDTLFEGFGEEMRVRGYGRQYTPIDHVHSGMDVPWRSIVKASSRLSCYRTHSVRAICCPCTQFKTSVWNPVSSGSNTFSQWKGRHWEVHLEHLRMPPELDNGAYSNINCENVTLSHGFCFSGGVHWEGDRPNSRHLRAERSCHWGC